MNKELIRNHYKLLQEHQNSFLISFKEYLADQSIPLDERYELFIEFDLGEIEDYLINEDQFFNIDQQFNIDLLEDLYYGRYTTVSLDDLIEENPEYIKDESGLKEWMINNFVKGFKLDW